MAQTGRTAQEVVAADVVDDEPTDARHPFVDYVEALTAYESRDDVEPLAARRVRENADTFAAANPWRADDAGVNRD